MFLTQSDDGTNTLTLKGNGDMLLSAGDSDANHTNGRAGLNTWPRPPWPRSPSEASLPSISSTTTPYSATHAFRQVCRKAARS